MGSGLDKLTDCYDIIPFFDVDHKNMDTEKSYCVKQASDYNFNMYDK